MANHSEAPESEDEGIIDIHSHLGNIVEHDGGEIIHKEGIKAKSVIDPGWFVRRAKFGKKVRRLTGLLRRWGTYAGRERIKGATLENMQKAREGTGIALSCVLPVPPHVRFGDLKAASEADPRVIPFTGVDFNEMEGFEDRLRREVAQGAKGMKIHPIIQNVSPVDPRMHAVLDEFAQYDLPILFHSGRVTYYFGEDKKRENVDYGDIELIHQMIKDNRGRTKIILGHSGMDELDYVIDEIAPHHDNVFVDTTFRHPYNIQRLVNAFGSERVAFGSDWPYGGTKLAVKCANLAFQQEADKRIQARVMRENARNLLKLG